MLWSRSNTQLSCSMAVLSSTFFSDSACNNAVLQPRGCRNTRGLGYSPFARHYWGNHSYFLFLQVLRCFSSLRWPPPAGFGDPRVKGHLHLTAAFRSLSRPSSPPRA